MIFQGVHSGFIAIGCFSGDFVMFDFFFNVFFSPGFLSKSKERFHGVVRLVRSNNTSSCCPSGGFVVVGLFIVALILVDAAGLCIEPQLASIRFAKKKVFASFWVPFFWTPCFLQDVWSLKREESGAQAWSF